MGQQSPVLVPLLIGIVIGVAAASFTAWRILRSRIEAARRETRNEGQIEIARLSERLSRSSETEIKLAECASLAGGGQQGGNADGAKRPTA
jgi:hypothetical protein